MTKVETIRYLEMVLADLKSSDKEWYGVAIHDGKDLEEIEVDSIEVIEGNIGCQLVIELE